MMFGELYSWSAVAPAVTVLAAAAIVLVVDLFVRPGHRLIPWLAAAGLLAGIVVSALMWGTREKAFSGAWFLGEYSIFFYILFCAVAIVTVILSTAHEERRGRFPGEYYSLLLFSVVGMMAMASAEDLITLIIGLETMSLCAYVLVGLNRWERRSGEGAIKYFLLGAFASAFLIYGTALIYGATGTTGFDGIAAFMEDSTEGPGLLLLSGALLLLVGLGFKVAAVPFHMWAPDAYQAAPTPITGFMATAVKAAGFAAVVKIFGLLLATPATSIQNVIWWIALLSMVVGNFAAIAQMNLKRMLAYSSVAHVGYLLTAVVGSAPSSSPLGGTGVLYYLAAYALMTLGAFSVLVVAGGGADRRETLTDLAGLAGKSPALALAMTIFMVSLSGIPPTVGFFGKFYAFGAAVQSGYIGLAVVGVLTSVVAVFYYFRVVVYMYMKPPEKTYLPYGRPRLANLTVGILAIAVLYAGIFPETLLQLARHAFLSLF
jgi:NADH-quinone oxidoreductase subunit N